MRGLIQLATLALIWWLVAFGPFASGANLTAQSPPAPTVYVAPDGTDTGTCATPMTRCRTLQFALQHLESGGEARLASGIYTSTTRIDRSATIAGGFALPDYVPGTQPTVLDGNHLDTPVYIDNAGHVYIADVTITGGVAARGWHRVEEASTAPSSGATRAPIGRGGGVRIEGSTATLERVQVIGNTASEWGNGQGGGIYVRESQLTVIDSNVMSNTASLLTTNNRVAQPGAPQNAWLSNPPILTGQGGGIYAEGSHLTIRNSRLAYNSAAVSSSGYRSLHGLGGGIYATGSLVEAYESSMSANKALQLGTTTSTGFTFVSCRGAGGGAYLADGRTDVRGGAIAGNQASTLRDVPNQGGALVLAGSTSSQLNQVAIEQNSASTGAGVWLTTAFDPAGTAALTLTNVLLAGHRGPALEAAGDRPDAAYASVRHATIVSNSTGLLAGPGSAISVTNSLLIENQIAAQGTAGGYVWLQHTNRYANAVAAQGDVRPGPKGDLAVAPAFVPGDTAFHLSPESPLVDRGLPLADVANDFEGEPRPIDGNHDRIALPDPGWDELAVSAAAFGPSRTLFAAPGQRLTTSVHMRNEGLINDTFVISATAPPGWSVNITPTTVELDRRERARLTVSIQVPASAQQNTRGEILIEARGRTSSATTTIVVNVGNL